MTWMFVSNHHCEICDEVASHRVQSDPWEYTRSQECLQCGEVSVSDDQLVRKVREQEKAIESMSDANCELVRQVAMYKAELARVKDEYGYEEEYVPTPEEKAASDARFLERVKKTLNEGCVQRAIHYGILPDRRHPLTDSRDKDRREAWCREYIAKHDHGQPPDLPMQP